MYKGGFCVNVKQNGKIIDDLNGTAAIMFGEYSLRLRNKNCRDAVATINIDGKNVTEKGDLILHSGDTVEIERYISDLGSGRKFKFVSLDDVSRSERDNPKNGIIEVKFRLTKEPVERIIYHYPFYHHYYYPQVTWADYPSWTPNNWGTITCGDANGMATTTTMGNTINAVYCSNSSGITLNKSSISCSNISDVSDGKTVEGSYSGQKFNYSFCGALEEKETVIRLKIVGYDDEDKKNEFEILGKCNGKYCSSCGNKRNLDDKFCGNCGNKL